MPCEGFGQIGIRYGITENNGIVDRINWRQSTKSYASDSNSFYKRKSGLVLR